MGFNHGLGIVVFNLELRNCGLYSWVRNFGIQP
jgi:hypothetical protein